MSLFNNTGVRTGAAVAAQPYLEAAQPINAATESTRLVGADALSADQATQTGYFQSVKNQIQKLSTKQKLGLAAGIALGIGGATAAAIVFWPHAKEVIPPLPPCWKVPHHATEICNAISTIGKQSLEWLSQAPNITALTSMQNGIREMFCNGTKVVDPATIAWAQNLLPQLSNAIANQTAIALTGFPYDPTNPAAHDSTPQRLYDLVYHANVDFKQTDNWFGMEDFWAPGWIQWAPQYITMKLMSQGATMALKEFCDRMNYSDILFGNGTYTCVAKQFADYIPQFAGWCFWRNQTISS